MKNINDVMPKIPGMKWGALTNYFPTNAKLKELNRLLPHDKKWHTVMESDHSVVVDGHPIIRKTAESMA